MTHPYRGLPDRQFWKKELGIASPRMLDPVVTPRFHISASDRIVTAGSCFAQHVARFMSDAGFNHHITEKAHPIVPEVLAKQHNYGMFSCRYGNVYTARQLRQLIDRAFGRFAPIAEGWRFPGSNDSVVDPFRPQIQPGGFASEQELAADREYHFRCIRKALTEMDVFVFTLGLTEAWADRRDGAVFPVAPGVAGGEHDPETVSFVNFDEVDTYADLHAALSMVRQMRPEVKIVLTVSPVPLNATYEDRHVLLSTTWSKAVLRIAAEKAARHFSDCVYFPSYEIITSPHVRGCYYAADCREVTPEGVSHVMKLFLEHFAGPEAVQKPAQPVARAEPDRHLAEMTQKAEILCDEAAIDNR